MNAMSWPARQELKGRIDQVIAVALAVLAAWVAAFALRLGFATAAVIALLFAGGALRGFTRAGRRAARARIGRLSERAVRRELAQLAREGWRVVHSLRWRRRGDIDHVTIAPSGTGFVIETKTRTYTQAHLERTREAAAALAAHRPGSAVHAVLCVRHADVATHWEHGVLVVGLHRLVPALRALERRSYSDAAPAIA